MFYCKKCKKPELQDRCSYCGAKRLKEIKNNDEVFLCIKGPMQTAMFEEMLKNNEIPMLKIPRFSFPASTRMFGSVRGSEFKIFVPFGALDKAQDLLKLFGEEENL